MKLKDNYNIFVSISAGYSSLMMAIMMKEWYPDHNIIYVMANTSKERPESLYFMNEVSNLFKLNMVWLEAEFHEKGVGVTYKEVSYENLKVNGEIFEIGIKKYGIPSVVNKWCNRDMKVVPMKKYADDFFGKNNYSIALGIRVDEIDRVGKYYKENNIFYPLIENNIDSRLRNKFWEKQPIKITIPAFKGNCDLCFEKSNRKLMTILKEEPLLGDWWQSMIDNYGCKTLKGKKGYNDLIEQEGVMTFYRKYKSINDLVEMAKKPFSKATDEYVYENDFFDLEDDCGSGCQVFN